MEDFQVLPIHKHNDLLSDCVKLLNSEWPRSETARLRSLQSSCDNLPTSLVLITGSDSKEIVGHSKITPLHSVPKACFIESVLIDNKHRGKGWGKYLMEETEKYIKNLGLENVYLTTQGQEEFYRKLGYIETEPVTVFGGTSNIYSLAAKHEVSLNEVLTHNRSKFRIPISFSFTNKKSNSPPPPPPFPTNQSVPKSLRNLTNKTFMKKKL